MSNNIFETSNKTDSTISTLNMSSAVRNNRYTIPNSVFSATSSIGGGGIKQNYSATSSVGGSGIKQNYSATSSVGDSGIKQNYSATSAFTDSMMGGSIEETRSIPIDQSELRQLFTGGNPVTSLKQTNTNSINGLVDKINSITESQAGGGSCSVKKNDDDDSESSAHSNSSLDQDDQMLLEGGAAPHLEAMLKLNKHIVNKAGIKFGKVVMKIAKHYREIAKKSNANGNIIELSNEAVVLVTKDADSGKLAGVVKSMGGTSQARAKGVSKSRKQSTPKAKSAKAKGKKLGNKHGGASSSLSDGDSSFSSELSFISTSSD